MIAREMPRGDGESAGSAEDDEVDEVAEALAALRARSPGAMDRLMPLVYEQLRRVAHRQLDAEPTGHTLSTTALVHETYLKLADQTRAEWRDRAQFFAVASRAMRRILIDYARRHRAIRRGGQPGGRRPEPISLDDVEIPVTDRADALLALDEALDRLARLDERLARIVECRFFGGLTEAETADALGLSKRTVAREWAVARGWLHEELTRDDG